jgi:cytochrome c-type biogenesis protein CcmH/NrfF
VIHNDTRSTKHQIKFLVKLGKSGNEIREMLVQVYGDNAMKETAVYKWAKRFSKGRESVT